MENFRGELLAVWRSIKVIQDQGGFVDGRCWYRIADGKKRSILLIKNIDMGFLKNRICGLGNLISTILTCVLRVLCDVIKCWYDLVVGPFYENRASRQETVFRRLQSFLQSVTVPTGYTKKTHRSSPPGGRENGRLFGDLASYSKIRQFSKLRGQETALFTFKANRLNARSASRYDIRCHILKRSLR